MKPVALFAYLIGNSTSPQGVVYDPFLGSGTTLIAAEQLGRTCYGIEISPQYCDVIVRRWQQLTGSQATRVNSERAACDGICILPSMKTKTVFVLGAGASAPYGVTTGKDLPDKVATSVGQIGHEVARALSEKRESSIDIGAMRNDAVRLANQIRRSRTPTIDAFIESCPAETKPRLVQGMIDVIWKAEYAAARSTDRVEDDWLAEVFHSLLLTDPETFPANQLAVVSFNYDRLPQMLMASMMANTHSVGVGRSWSALNQLLPIEGMGGIERFTHVHGCILCEPSLNEENQSVDLGYSRSDLRGACKNIKTMGGSPSIEEAAHFQLLWNWADRIYFLGFGYHEYLLNYIGLTLSRIEAFAKDGKLIGGTGKGLSAMSKNEVRARVGQSFRLGGPDDGCVSFLQQHILGDEELERIRANTNYAEE